LSARAALANLARLRRLDRVAIGGFTTAKKLCTGRLRGRVDGLTAAQNARISANRFALAARFPAACSSPRRRRERDSRFRFGLR